MAKTQKALKYVAAGAKPALAAKQMGISYASFLDARLRITALKAIAGRVPQQRTILLGRNEKAWHESE